MQIIFLPKAIYFTGKVKDFRRFLAGFVAKPDTQPVFAPWKRNAGNNLPHK